MLQGIHHTAILCSDYKNSRHFYSTILSLEIIADNYRKDRDSYKLDLKLPNGNQLKLFSIPGSPERLSYPDYHLPALELATKFEPGVTVGITGQHNS